MLPEFMARGCQSGWMFSCCHSRQAEREAGDEPHPALLVDYLPLLRGLVEFDLAGPG